LQVNGLNISITSEHNLHKLTYSKQIESLQYEIKLLEEKNANLCSLNRDLQKEVSTLRAKYQSQFDDLKSKMIKQMNEYKKQRQDSFASIQTEINRLRQEKQTALKSTTALKHMVKENEQLSAENNELKQKQNALVNDLAALQLNIQYFKTRYEALQNQFDLVTFDYDKYTANLQELKEQLLHKQHVIDYTTKIVDSLLKNTVCDLIPYSVPLNEVEGQHNDFTHKQHALRRSIIRLDALKVSELVTWFNYANKFYSVMDILSEYELISRRERSRMKNVVSMLGEKVKALNVRNISPSQLVALSRDLKQSYESISSEVHLKEYELSAKRKEFLKQIVTANTMMGVSPQTHDAHDHTYNVSFSSMVSLSMVDTPNGRAERTQSMHSLSPSLDGTESTIGKHRKKSDTIKGSGLKLLTDEDTLNKYLTPQRKEMKEAREMSQTASVSVTDDAHQREKSLSMNTRNKPTEKMYTHYSAFNTNNPGSRYNANPPRSHRSHRTNRSHQSLQRAKSTQAHYKNSSLSSNGHRSRRRNNSNVSIKSISTLSGIGDNDSNYGGDGDDDDNASVVYHSSPVDTPVAPTHTQHQAGHGIPMFNPTSNATLDEDNEVSDHSETQLSNDILSFFAM